MEDRQSIRYHKRLGKFIGVQKELHYLLKEYGNDILKSENFKKSSDYIQHGSISVNKHCIDVAKYSLALNKKFGSKCSQRDLVRGALLHDYFLYDWHNKNHEDRKGLHGFYHPGIALRNASQEYELTNREKDIIKKHMWPLTVVPPLCKEAWIVTTADKYCSLLETLHVHKTKVRKKVKPQKQQKEKQKMKVQYQG